MRYTKKLLLIACLISNTLLVLSQTKPTGTPQHPKIVIGMMVDQMRWDYLYKYKDRYSEGGFLRLLREGFSCENTMVDYTPTVTACGHTAVYTGSVPAVHGIVGNSWYNRYQNKEVECVEDEHYSLVGSQGKAMSPHNNFATTITDQLRIATNFKSKTVGVAIKDRGAILPAGHSATGAFWYSGSDGNFVSSTYYLNELPDWVKKFNDKKIVDSYYNNDWETLFPIDSYILSAADDKVYENKANDEEKPVFPHKLKQFKGNNYGAIRNTAYGNSLTFEFSKAAIEGYNLGAGNVTDFLAISLSSPDAIGHTYGPNSIEMEDNYLRLDRELAAFLTYLDNRFGKGNYLYFITADHAVSESPGFLMEHKLPGGALKSDDYKVPLINELREKYGVDKPILSVSNFQLYMNWNELEAKGADRLAVEQIVRKNLLKVEGIADVVNMQNIGAASLPDHIKKMLANGYNAKRSGDFMIIVQPHWKGGSINGASHSAWNPYDAHIPLIWMGWNIKPGYTNRVTAITDIAPTIAAMLRIQMPSGCIGNPIKEVSHK